MPQTLNLPGGKVIVDRMFRDDGSPPVMGMFGGQKTVMDPGHPPMKTVCQRGTAFFFLDEKQTPVKSLEDIEVIPERSPYRKMAEAFVELQQKGGKAAETAIRKARPERTRRTRRVVLKMRDATADPKRIQDSAVEG